VRFLCLLAARARWPSARRTTIRPGTFRSSVQPVVRAAASGGASIAELTALLRSTHARAYRRVDMLADLRGYRLVDLRSAVFARFIDPRGSIAKAGVAAFSLSLLVPSFASGMTRPSSGAIVAATVDTQPALVLKNPLPDPVPDFRLETEPGPPPVPRPEPAPRPMTLAMPGGGYGDVVTASWYGPGFFENRLPCWRWLEANGQPIQFLPETWGVAHKTLACGTLLTLQHGGNVISVPVVDRGPYVAGRELDLSPRVKAALGCADLCTVVMQIR